VPTAAELYDVIYSYKDYAREAGRVDRAIQEYQAAGAGERLLDVACGTGMHLSYLRTRYDVQGLDISPDALAIAEQRCPGVPFYVGNMRTFQLKERFDVVTCLFGAVGYMTTLTDLSEAIAQMALHLKPGGVLVVEPFIHPDRFEDGHVGGITVDRPDLKVARFSVSRREGRLCHWDFHYLVASPEGVEHFVEPHVLGLFTQQEYRDTFRAVGLETHHDPEGIAGRGLFIGVKPT